MLATRPNARKYTVVVSDGHSTQYTQWLDRYARDIRNLKESMIFGIGVDGHADLKELELISGDPNKVLMIQDFEQIGRIKGVRSLRIDVFYNKLVD